MSLACPMRLMDNALVCCTWGKRCVNVVVVVVVVVVVNYYNYYYDDYDVVDVVLDDVNVVEDV